MSKELNKDNFCVRCKRCNRLLTNEVAKSRGYGNHCWMLHNKEIKYKQKYLFDLPEDK